MQMILTIDMDNAVFEDAPATEAARILRELARQILQADDNDGEFVLMDANGNKVGTASIGA